MYTIGIRREFFPGFKRYKVRKHQTETELKFKTQDGAPVIEKIKPRLVLTLPDGTLTIISRIEEKDWCIYPDFIEDQKRWQAKELVAKSSTEQAATPQ